MTNLRLSRTQLEKAFVAYFESEKMNTKWSGVPVHARMGEVDQQTGKFKLTKLEEIPLPCIAIAAPMGTRHTMGFLEIELHVIILGSIDETDLNPDPLNTHTELVGWVLGLMGDDRLEIIKTAVNKPASGPDLRTVKDFNLIGYIIKDESSQETDRAFIDDSCYTTHSQPTDDLSG